MIYCICVGFSAIEYRYVKQGMRWDLREREREGKDTESLRAKDDWNDRSKKQVDFYLLSICLWVLRLECERGKQMIKGDSLWFLVLWLNTTGESSLFLSFFLHPLQDFSSSLRSFQPFWCFGLEIFLKKFLLCNLYDNKMLRMK